jgi:hypothetical protein
MGINGSLTAAHESFFVPSPRSSSRAVSSGEAAGFGFSGVADTTFA